MIHNNSHSYFFFVFSECGVSVYCFVLLFFIDLGALFRLDSIHLIKNDDVCMKMVVLYEFSITVHQFIAFFSNFSNFQSNQHQKIQKNEKSIGLEPVSYKDDAVLSSKRFFLENARINVEKKNLNRFSKTRPRKNSTELIRSTLDSFWLDTNHSVKQLAYSSLVQSTLGSFHSVASKIYLYKMAVFFLSVSQFFWSNLV